MSEPARHDPPVGRFVPDPELVARAQRAMMGDEDDRGGRGRFVRQRWEEAFGAARVCLDALREISPIEDMVHPTPRRIADALTHAESTYRLLDGASEKILGAVMHDVLIGKVRTHEQLDALGVPR